jgi:hypothetical protein
VDSDSGVIGEGVLWHPKIAPMPSAGVWSLLMPLQAHRKGNIVPATADAENAHFFASNIGWKSPAIAALDAAAEYISLRRITLLASISRLAL